jgi:hypothetical protein
VYEKVDGMFFAAGHLMSLKFDRESEFFPHPDPNHAAIDDFLRGTAHRIVSCLNACKGLNPENHKERVWKGDENGIPVVSTRTVPITTGPSMLAVCASPATGPFDG